jgi:hypothetical protein
MLQKQQARPSRLAQIMLVAHLWLLTGAYLIPQLFGVAALLLRAGIPVVFGVITTETMEQALDRAGGKVGNKGGEAAATAVEMATLLADLRADGLASEPHSE